MALNAVAAPLMTYCAIDFGTSNSAVALPDGASIRLAPVEGDATTLPTAVFFNTDEDEYGSRRRLCHPICRCHHPVPAAPEAKGASGVGDADHARSAGPPGVFR